MPTIERLPIPDDMDTWQIPDSLKYFLLFDSRADYGAHRFMVFTTPFELKELCKSEEAFSDGTWHTPNITNDNNHTDTGTCLVGRWHTTTLLTNVNGTPPTGEHTPPPTTTIGTNC